jgi:hypothetical protein
MYKMDQARIKSHCNVTSMMLDLHKSWFLKSQLKVKVNIFFFSIFFFLQTIIIKSHLTSFNKLHVSHTDLSKIFQTKPVRYSYTISPVAYRSSDSFPQSSDQSQWLMHTHACIYMHTHTSMHCTYIHTHACIYLHTHTSMHCTYIHTHACIYMHTHTNMHCTYIHTHACIYLHTHTSMHCTYIHTHAWTFMHALSLTHTCLSTDCFNCLQ